jgi:hypothetical protein
MTKRSEVPTATSAAKLRSRALMWLRSNSWPRIAMSLMLMITMGSAFVASVLLHHAGLVPLVRYPLSVLVGWGVFLSLVGVWVMWQRWRHAPAEVQRVKTTQAIGSRVDARSENASALDDLVNDLARTSKTSDSRQSGGRWAGGGRFGGAGASESFAETSNAAPLFGNNIGIASGGLNLSLDGGGDDEASQFLWLIIAILVVVLFIFGAAFYAVYSAPMFFAELLIDGGVGTWLYKRGGVAANLDHTNDAPWLMTAIKRSAWPVAILVALFVALAGAMYYVAPEATSLIGALDTFARS